MRVKPLFVILPLIVAAVIVFLIPVEFPYTITTTGKILPLKSWIVSKGNSGQLITFIHDRKKGIIDNYSVKEFERGDDIKLSLNPDFRIGWVVDEKDTIGFIYSNEIEVQIAFLESRLALARSSLEFNMTGEKESIIKEAEENLNFAVTQAEEQKKILDRQKALYEKNLISLEEYELASGQAKLNDIAVDIAQARLESVSTGAKNEQIELIKSEIKSLHEQIGVLRKRYHSHYLVSPLQGVVTNLASGDTLFSISDNRDYVVMIPVRVSESQYVSDNAGIEIRLPDASEDLKGEIIFTDNAVLALLNEQVMVFIGSVETNEPLAYGLMVECKIDCGSISIYEHLKRLMSRNIF